MTTIMTASNQWASRPADERFWDLREMRSYLETRTAADVEVEIQPSRMAAVPVEGNVALTRGNGKVYPTNWAFSQLCGRIGAPAQYLQSLPVEMACPLINHGLQELPADYQANLLVNNSTLRAVTSDRYVRVTDLDVVKRLEEFVDAGWSVPPARPANIAGERTRVATEADVSPLQIARGGGLAIRPGDLIAPAGLYASDRDMFVIMIDEKNLVQTPQGTALARAIMLSNSEVGARSWTLTTMLLDFVCSNHIIWGAQGVTEYRFRHVGDIANKWVTAKREVATLSAASASDTESAIRTLQTQRVADTAEKVEDALYEKGILSRRAAKAALDLAEAYEQLHGDPLSRWGVMSGITRLSQQQQNSDKREVFDVAASRVLTAKF